VNGASASGSEPDSESGLAREACGSQHCITCGDDGVPMTVVRVDQSRGLALCEQADGTRATVEIALIDAVAPEDTLLVHAGTALTRLEPAA
jgi:hydrogenase maturation factor